MVPQIVEARAQTTLVLDLQYVDFDAQYHISFPLHACPPPSPPVASRFFRPAGPFDRSVCVVDLLLLSGRDAHLCVLGFVNP